MGSRDFPEDLVMEIMALLPVKSIVRFRSVCKSWYALLRNSIFINQHLIHPSSSHNHESILSFECCRWCSKPRISLLSNQNWEDVSMPFFNDFAANLRIYGPCDGLIFLYHPDTDNHHADDKIALWNPATRDFRALPLSRAPPRPESGAHISSMDFGIGFDYRTKDYKVVCVSSYQKLEVDQVEVYSLSTKSWRKIDTIVPAKIWSNPKISTYVKGFYYWPASDKDENVILSFDMSNEVFQKMLPPLEIGDGDQAARLDAVLEFNGSLSAICRTTDWSDPLTIWVMNEDKWIKYFKIDLYLRGLGLCKNGSILIEGHSIKGEELLSYSSDTGEIGHHGAHENPNGLQIVLYKESLVAL